MASCRPDEDPRGGFERGGWATPYFDSVSGRVAAEGIATQPALLFGRRTYQDFYAVWPRRTGNMFTEVLNNAQKYVSIRVPSAEIHSLWGGLHPALEASHSRRRAALAR